MLSNLEIKEKENILENLYIKCFLNQKNEQCIKIKNIIIIKIKKCGSKIYMKLEGK